MEANSTGTLTTKRHPISKVSDIKRRRKHRFVADPGIMPRYVSKDRKIEVESELKTEEQGDQSVSGKKVRKPRQDKSSERKESLSEEPTSPDKDHTRSKTYLDEFLKHATMLSPTKPKKPKKRKEHPQDADSSSETKEDVSKSIAETIEIVIQKGLAESSEVFNQQTYEQIGSGPKHSTQELAYQESPEEEKKSGSESRTQGHGNIGRDLVQFGGHPSAMIYPSPPKKRKESCYVASKKTGSPEQTVQQSELREDSDHAKRQSSTKELSASTKHSPVPGVTHHSPITSVPQPTSSALAYTSSRSLDLINRLTQHLFHGRTTANPGLYQGSLNSKPNEVSSEEQNPSWGQSNCANVCYRSPQTSLQEKIGSWSKSPQEACVGYPYIPVQGTQGPSAMSSYGDAGSVKPVKVKVSKPRKLRKTQPEKCATVQEVLLKKQAIEEAYRKLMEEKQAASSVLKKERVQRPGGTDYDMHTLGHQPTPQVARKSVLKESSPPVLSPSFQLAQIQNSSDAGNTPDHSPPLLSVQSSPVTPTVLKTTGEASFQESPENTSGSSVLTVQSSSIDAARLKATLKDQVNQQSPPALSMQKPTLESTYLKTCASEPPILSMQKPSLHSTVLKSGAGTLFLDSLGKAAEPPVLSPHFHMAVTNQAKQSSPVNQSPPMLSLQNSPEMLLDKHVGMGNEDAPPTLAAQLPHGATVVTAQLLTSGQGVNGSPQLSPELAVKALLGLGSPGHSRVANGQSWNVVENKQNQTIEDQKQQHQTLEIQKQQSAMSKTPVSMDKPMLRSPVQMLQVSEVKQQVPKNVKTCESLQEKLVKAAPFTIVPSSDSKTKLITTNPALNIQGKVTFPISLVSQGKPQASTGQDSTLAHLKAILPKGPNVNIVALNQLRALQTCVSQKQTLSSNRVLPSEAATTRECIKTKGSLETGKHFIQGYVSLQSVKGNNTVSGITTVAAAKSNVNPAQVASHGGLLARPDQISGQSSALSQYQTACQDKRKGCLGYGVVPSNIHGHEQSQSSSKNVQYASSNKCMSSWENQPRKTSALGYQSTHVQLISSSNNTSHVQRGQSTSGLHAVCGASEKQQPRQTVQHGESSQYGLNHPIYRPPVHAQNPSNLKNTEQIQQPSHHRIPEASSDARETLWSRNADEGPFPNYTQAEPTPLNVQIPSHHPGSGDHMYFSPPHRRLPERPEDGLQEMVSRKFQFYFRKALYSVFCGEKDI